MPNKPLSAIERATAPESRRQLTAETSYSGPLPPPELMRRYDELVPGAAERILRMAEQEAAHRQRASERQLDASIKLQEKQLDLAELQANKVFKSDTLGQILGLMVSLACIAGAVYLAMNGQAWVAAAMVGLPLAAIIKAFQWHKTEKNN